jgi:hypothetical protein
MVRRRVSGRGSGSSQQRWFLWLIGFQQGVSPEVFQMELVIGVVGLWAVMVAKGLLVKRLSEMPWFKK